MRNVEITPGEVKTISRLMYELERRNPCVICGEWSELDGIKDHNEKCLIHKVKKIVHVIQFEQQLP